MPRKKRQRSKKEEPVPRTLERETGLWLAPDLERRTKGEGGRRGMADPPYAYYLQLADVALEPSKPKKKRKAGPVEPIFPVSFETSAVPSVPTADQLPPMIPAAALPKPPKLALPKPMPRKPPRLSVPKPAKRGVPKPPPSPKVPKLAVPKPPRRKG